MSATDGAAPAIDDGLPTLHFAIDSSNTVDDPRPTISG